MTTPSVTTLVSPAVIHCDDAVVAWHTGLVSAHDWIVVGIVIEPNAQIVHEHRKRIQDEIASGDQMNLSSLRDSVKVSISSRSTVDKVKLWKGGDTSDLEPRVVQYHEKHYLAPGDYQLEISVTAPIGVNFRWSADFSVA